MDAADDGTYLDAHGPMELLKQNHVENRVIHVDASKFGLLDTLTEQSLALTKLYTGRKQIPFPEGFHQLCRPEALHRGVGRRVRRDAPPPSARGRRPLTDSYFLRDCQP